MFFRDDEYVFLLKNGVGEGGKTSSFNHAVARSHFAALWSSEVDPVDAFERSVIAEDGQVGLRN